MNYVFEPPKQAVIPVAGEGAAFPVRRIWCVGRNYADHTREMGGDPANDAPIFFSKPADAVTTDRTLSFPVHTDNLSHEVELVVAISGTGAGIDPDRAEDLIYGYAVGLDMTRRDLQAVAKKAGQPWDLSKGFDQSCPVSAIAPSSRIGHPAAGGITLHVNGKLRQDGKLEHMIWPVRPGDTLHAECKGIGKLEVTYTAHS